MSTRERGDVAQNSAHAHPAGRGPDLLVANPTAAIVRDGTRYAVGHGLDRDGIARLRDAMRLPVPGLRLADLVTGQEEATIVFGDAGAAGGPVIEAWRGQTSNYEVYLAGAGTGELHAVADHFRDALALLPRVQRVLDPSAIADHLLFGVVPGTRTYITAISRLGHGEYYRWQNGRSERRVFDPLIARPQLDAASLDLIDAALTRAIERMHVEDDCVLQLSGGVDSSLLQTYLPAGLPTVSGAIDSPEYARERTYAERASKLLGTKHRIILAPESDFLSMVSDVIRLCGQPFRMPQTAVYQQSFRFPAARFINGQFADALFGVKRSIAYMPIMGQRRRLRLAKSMGIAHLLPREMANGLQRRLERLRQIEAPINDWQGLGTRYAVYSNLALAERIIGIAAIQQRIESRVAYTAARFRPEDSDPNPLFAHLEFGHMLDFLCDESISRWRHLVHAQNKNLLPPFVCRSVVAAALTVPRTRRYYANGRMKYLLKDLLKRRSPAFNVDAPKAGGELPIQRYFGSELLDSTFESYARLFGRETAAVWRTSVASSRPAAEGPLKSAFERYAMPDFVEREIAAATCATPDWLTWNLLTLAIWRDEVLADSTLSLLPNTRVVAATSPGLS